MFIVADVVSLNMFKPSCDFYLPFKGGDSFMDPFCYMYLSLIVFNMLSLQPRDQLLKEGWPFGSPVCDISLRLCHFPI